VNYDSPAQIERVLLGLEIKLKHRWGQNFLINRGAREKLIALIDPREGDRVWEIGPGLGCLTASLLPRVRNLTAFEIDRGLIRFLEQSFGGFPGFALVAGDVLKTWSRIRREGGEPDKVTGNLPYSSASALIGAFAEQGFTAPRMIFTVQKELARRMAARPGAKNYSSFSVLSQFAFRLREHFELKPGSFYPAPEVLSTVIELTPQAHEEEPSERDFFLLLVRALFSSRRKTLKNNLFAAPFPAGYDRDLLLQALALEGLDPGLRGEELPPQSFIRLCNRLLALRQGR